jgi:hypothetical protein
MYPPPARRAAGSGARIDLANVLPAGAVRARNPPAGAAAAAAALVANSDDAPAERVDRKVDEKVAGDASAPAGGLLAALGAALAPAAAAAVPVGPPPLMAADPVAVLHTPAPVAPLAAAAAAAAPLPAAPPLAHRVHAPVPVRVPALPLRFAVPPAAYAGGRGGGGDDQEEDGQEDVYGAADAKLPALHQQILRTSFLDNLHSTWGTCHAFTQALYVKESRSKNELMALSDVIDALDEGDNARAVTTRSVTYWFVVFVAPYFITQSTKQKITNAGKIFRTLAFCDFVIYASSSRPKTPSSL